MDESDKFKESMVEKILLTLERIDETAKAETIGNLFKLYVLKAMSRERFFRLSGIVERAFLYDLLALHYRESYYVINEGSDEYRLGIESQVALHAYGLMEQYVGEARSFSLEASGREGTEPKLMFKVSPLGRALANSMLYDLNDPSFYRYVKEQIKNLRTAL
jgi:hypothetical protein